MYVSFRNSHGPKITDSTTYVTDYKCYRNSFALILLKALQYDLSPVCLVYLFKVDCDGSNSVYSIMFKSIPETKQY